MIKKFFRLFSREKIKEFFSRPLEESYVVKFWMGLRIIGHLFNKRGVWSHASVCAYATILSLVPVVAVTLILLSAFTSENTTIEEFELPVEMERDESAQAESDIDDATGAVALQSSMEEHEGEVPGELSEFSNEVFDFIFEQFVPGVASGAREELMQAKQQFLLFIQRAAALRFITFFVLIIACVSLYNSIEHAFNEIWYVRHRRTLFSKILACWLLLTLTPLLLGLSYYYSTQIRASLSSSLFMEKAWTSWMINHLISYFLTLCAFLFANLYLPNLRVNVFPALVGSALSAILFESAKIGFDLYISYVTSQTSSYYSVFGTVAAIPIFILWLYYSFICFLLGPVIAHTIQDFKQHVSKTKRKEFVSFHRPLHSFKVFLDICGNFRNHENGVSSTDLRNETGWSSFQIRKCLYDLEKVNLIHQGKKDDLYYPNIDPDNIKVSDVMERLLGFKATDKDKKPIHHEPWLDKLRELFFGNGELTISSLLEKDQYHENRNASTGTSREARIAG